MRIIITFLFCCALSAVSFVASSPTWAQGYDGLMAPDTSATPAPSIDDKKMTTTQKRKAQKNAPRVYKSTPAKKSVPTDAFKSQQSQNPLSAVPTPSTSQSAEDLKKQALILKYIQDNADKMKVSNAAAQKVDWSGMEYTRIEGLLPMQYAIKTSIEKYMSVIGDKTVSEERRRQVARIAYKDLMTMADGLKIKNAVPESIYKKSGVPDKFIKDSIEDTQSSLKMLDAAFKVLRPLQ